MQPVKRRGDRIPERNKPPERQTVVGEQDHRVGEKTEKAEGERG